MSDADAPTPLPEDADDLLPILESMLFAAHESLSAQRMARAIGHLKVERVSAAIEALQRSYETKRSPLMLVEIAGGWRLVTRPEYAPFLSRLFSRSEKERLSSAALETLAIVAYRQPATRAEIEAVRGVQVGPVLKLLQERRLVKMVGRAEVVGRPLQYGTTKKFLDHFGLASLEDLPTVFPGRAPPKLPEPLATSDEPAAEVDGVVVDEAVADEALADEGAAGTAESIASDGAADGEGGPASEARSDGAVDDPSADAATSAGAA